MGIRLNSQSEMRVNHKFTTTCVKTSRCSHRPAQTPIHQSWPSPLSTNNSRPLLQSPNPSRLRIPKIIQSTPVQHYNNQVEGVLQFRILIYPTNQGFDPIQQSTMGFNPKPSNTSARELQDISQPIST